MASILKATDYGASAPWTPDLGDIVGNEGAKETLIDIKAVLDKVRDRGAAHARVATDYKGMFSAMCDKQAEEQLKKFFSYQEPFRNFTHYRFVPVLVSFEKQVHTVVKKHSYEDFKFNYWLEDIEKNGSDKQLDIGDGELRAWAGPGYDDFILPSDGDGDWRYAAVALDDGTIVIGVTWLWFNK